MKTLLFSFLILALFCVSAAAQGTGTTEGEPKKPRIFRATKDQIKEVQTKLKTAKLYDGEATGKLDDATRASIKTWQGSNGLKQTATLNRATLEKMGIELTESQMTIPVSESSYASAESKPTKSSGEAKATMVSAESKPKRIIFRATKAQIMEAQKKLKAGSMYGGDETGKLDDATRDGLKKYQDANGLKVTGTLNQATLEKMGIDLTEKQKANAAAAEANK
jgi:peptidoglycan hydrolase-like protein with peptidoglycan-binding domain